MAKKATKSRPWTKEDVRTLKTLAREDKDGGDRAKTETECACDVSAGVKAGRDVGGRSREEEGVNLVRWAG
jgi:hypothetical protein